MSEKTSGRTRWGRRLLIVVLMVVTAALVGRRWLVGGGVEEGTWVLLDLEGTYAEEPPDSLLARLASKRPLSLLDLLLLIRDAGEDSRVTGMVVRVRALDVGWAKTQDVRDALIAFRATGKPLHAYLEQEFGNGTLEYYVASAAEKVYVPPGSAAPLTGLLAQYVFLGGVWEKLDIDMQVHKIREYKTAGDMLANKEMSSHHREMANSLLDSLYGQLVEGVASQRALPPDTVRAAIDRGPATPDELQEAGLGDGARFLDTLRVELVGEDGDFLAGTDYQAWRRPLPDEPSVDHRVAVIFGVGPITTGRSQSRPVDGAESMGADTIVEAFREAAEDETIEAIVFRVDSPGGSALASDLIWHATQEARAAKPVIVSMADVAASGGYYVSAGATEVFAQPGTLTGSIGVVVAKPNVSGLLAKLGVHTEDLSRGALAPMVSLTESFDAAQLERVETTMDAVYRLFLERVAAGRGLDVARVDDVGRGRVWTGAQAREHALVDELGGFLAAINAAKAAADIPIEEKVELVFYPEPRPWLERVADLLVSRVAGGLPRWWRQTHTALTAWRFPSGSVLTLLPQEISIR